MGSRGLSYGTAAELCMDTVDLLDAELAIAVYVVFVGFLLCRRWTACRVGDGVDDDCGYSAA